MSTASLDTLRRSLMPGVMMISVLSINFAAIPVHADVGVTTDAATNVTSTDATLNATNGDTASDQYSFWVSTTAGIDTSSSTIPPGVYSSVPGSGSAADAPFSNQLSDLVAAAYDASGTTTMPAITPATDYYYVAWSHVGGNWVHGAEQHFTTLADISGPDIYVANSGVDAAGHGHTAADPYQTIVYAVAHSSAGNTIHVAAGTYPENVTVDKSLTFLGANATIHGDDVSRTSESTVNGSFTVKASNVIIDGFAIDAPSNSGVLMQGSYTGEVVTDNVITDNGYAVNFNTGNTTVSYNKVAYGPSFSTGVEANSNPGNTLTFTGNVFSGTGAAAPADITVIGNVSPQTSDVTVTDNTSTSGTTLIALFNVDGATISGNTASGADASVIYVGGNDTDVTIKNNSITDSTTAVKVANDFGDGPNSNVTVVGGNDFSTDTNGVKVADGAYTAEETVDATNNWWGDASGPNDPTSADGSNPDTNAGSGSAAVGAVDYEGWCSNADCTPVVTGTCDASVNLLANSGFETPAVTTSANWDEFPSGTAGLGWIVNWLYPTSVTSGRPAIANLEFQRGYAGWTPSEGAQIAELDSGWSGPDSGDTTAHPSSIVISQQVATVVGDTYTFAFDFSARPGTDAAENSATARAGGVVIGAVGPTDGTALTNTSWTPESFTFVATSTMTTVSLEDSGTPSDSLGTLVDNTSLTCTPAVKHNTATVVATKVVCDDESDLPNANGASHITDENTAQAWVDQSDGKCHLAPDWTFEWGNQDAGYLGGTYIGHDPAYTAFGPTANAGTATVQVPVDDLSRIEVREQLQDGYVPFSDAGDVSAELSCSNDGTNYDNWEWITNPTAGSTYYCVAFNAPKPASCNEDAQTTLLSSDSNDAGLATSDETGPASIVSWLHPSWVQAIGQWIWKDTSTSEADAVNGATETFTRQFTITGTPLDASLDLAADNGFEVRVNGTEVVNNTDEHNYEATTTIAVPAADMHTGLNTITFAITNLPEADGTPESNPAGLLYKLTTNDNQCVTGTPTTEKVHILKYLDNSEAGPQPIANDATGIPEFPMVATWSDAGNGNDSGTGNYNLGEYFGGSSSKWGADTAVMATGANYSTNEVTDGSVVVASADACTSTNQYFLQGYMVGDDLAAAEAAPLSTTTPTFMGLTNDKTVIVVNTPCTGGGGGGGATLTIVKNTTGGDGDFNFNLDDTSNDDSNQQVDVRTTEGTGTSNEVGLTAGHTYDLSEVTQDDWSLNSANCTMGGGEANVGQQLSEDSPIEFTPRDGQQITCTFHNTNDSQNVNNYITVEAADLANDFTTAFTDPDWFMYNDSNDTIDSTLGSFIDGPATAPLGDGSVSFTLGDDPANRKDIATYQFAGTKLADITSLGFSAYSDPGTSGSGPNESPYMVLNVDFNNLGTWQKRLVFVPSQNDTVSIPQNAWNTYDALQSGNALWTWSGYAANGNQWPDSNTSEYRTWSAIKTAFPNAKIAVNNGAVTQGLLGVRVGEPGPTDYVGDVDAFVIGTTDGSTITTNTYDFEPTAVDNGGGSGSSGGHATKVQGHVLGASTTTEPTGQVLGATCGPLLTTFMHLGWASNVADEVSKLQTFLDTSMSAGVPVTGFFGPLTEAAVRTFQLAYASDVLTPWVAIPGSGITSSTDATGYVYKTTQWKINMLNCPDLNLPAPTLP